MIDRLSIPATSPKYATESIRLKAADGHELEAWCAIPADAPRGAIVVLQEIFGVTDHIRTVTEGFADAGYLAVAPALFDRIEPGIEVDYADIQRGRDLKMQSDPVKVMLDVQAAVDSCRTVGKIGTVGYCWGGGMSFLAACELDIDAAVSYYGAPVMELKNRQPRCPVMYHFGALDSLIPINEVDAIRAAQPGGEYHIYSEAGHGFNCDERADYRPVEAALALERTLDFFARTL